jgi:hydrogenase maturation protein HypF
MLPYMPIHYQLFRQLTTDAIVLTSGNFSSEPILIDNVLSLKLFSHLVDSVVLHNRDIYNRTDDSVVRIIDKKERIFRRSRGFVPTPVRTTFNTEGILAFGAELTNCFCVGKGTKSFLSQHIGDLQGLETTLFYEKTIARFIQLFRVKPKLLAVDLHPNYISTKTGLNFKADLPVVHVQHHHAHIASCMTEHHLDEKVIGVALDGTGFGTDGNIWGGEFFICDLNDFTRITHFETDPLRIGYIDIFINPPSLEALEARLRGRGTDSDAVIEKRLKNAEREMEQSGLYMHQIVNDDLDVAYRRLCDIINVRAQFV